MNAPTRIDTTRTICAFLFEGRLPDFNLGTAGGASCAPALQERLGALLGAQQQ